MAGQRSGLVNSDIRVCITLHRHWKYRKLKRMIGKEPMLYLVVFWGTVAQQVPNGCLDFWSASDIEDAADWDGDDGLLCQSMQEVGFLDVTQNGYIPHDWAEHQPWAIGAQERSKAASIAGKASAEARRNKARSNGIPTGRSTGR